MGPWPPKKNIFRGTTDIREPRVKDHRKEPQTRSPCRQWAPTERGPTDKGLLQTLCNFHRQRALTDNLGPLQTIRGLLTRGPYRPIRKNDKIYCGKELQSVDPTNKNLLQTLCNSYRRGAPTNKGSLHYIQARRHGKGLYFASYIAYLASNRYYATQQCL